MYDLIVVGGGPAGLTAAIYAIRKHLDILLISQELGGKTNFQMSLPDIEPHQVIRGVEIVDKFRRELAYMDFAHRLEGVETITKEDNHFMVGTSKGDEFAAKTVILATGSRVKYLNVPGELDYLGRGLSYSALSYAPLFVNKRVVVIGDGELAVRAVIELAQKSAVVHLIAPTLGALDMLPTKRLGVDDIKVVVLEGYSVKAIQGKEFVEQIILETPEGQETEIATDGIFVELGLIPNSDLVKELVELDNQGRVMVDNRNLTSCPGLLAAGDVTNAFAEQVLIAVGEGAKAALSAHEYLLTNL